MARSSFEMNDINDLSKWPMWLRLLMAVLLGFVIFMALRFFFVSKLEDEVASSQAALIKKKGVFIKDQNIVANLSGIRSDAKKLEKKLNILKKYLPAESDINNLIETLYKKGVENGINITLFEKGIDSKKESAFYTVKTFKLKTKAGYLAMTSFVHDISSLEQIMHFDSIAMEHLKNKKIYDGTSDAPLEVSATLKTYIFNGGK